MRLQIILCILGGTVFVSAFHQEYLRAHTMHYKDPVVDEMKVVCNALKVPAETEHETFYKLSNTSSFSLSYEDVLKLTVWNMKGGFKYRKLTKQLNFPAENWRKMILDDIFDMFKLACHNAYVPDEFLNIVYEMIMIYYNNALPKIKEDVGTRWNTTSDILERCKQEMHQLPLHDIAGLIDTISLEGHYYVLRPTSEMADSIPELDIFVDTLWWIFSFSYGACYYPAGYRSIWAPKYKKIFYEDFILPLLPFWTNPGPIANFGVMIGNFEVNHILQNVRSCTSAGYLAFDIQDRELVRPIMSPHGEGNFKTGDSSEENDIDMMANDHFYG